MSDTVTGKWHQTSVQTLKYVAPENIQHIGSRPHPATESCVQPPLARSTRFFGQTAGEPPNVTLCSERRWQVVRRLGGTRRGQILKRNQWNGK